MSPDINIIIIPNSCNDNRALNCKDLKSSAVAIEN